MDTMVDVTPLDRHGMARRLAADVPEGWVVNLGIGIPTLVSDHVPPEREVIFQAENGVIGVGPAPPTEEEDPWLINAGKLMVTLRPGGSFVSQSDSFALIRGGHLDLCVLGAFEVAENGDLANWKIPGKFSPGAGGGMELAQKARRVIVLTTHVDRSGNPKLLRRCTLPLTAPNCVSRIFTDMAVIDVTARGFELVERAEGVALADVVAATGATLHLPDEEIPVF